MERLEVKPGLPVPGRRGLDTERCEVISLVGGLLSLVLLLLFETASTGSEDLANIPVQLDIKPSLVGQERENHHKDKKIKGAQGHR